MGCQSDKGAAPSDDVSQGKHSTDAPLTLYYFDGFSGRADAPMLLLEDLGANYTMSSDYNGLLKREVACFAVPIIGDGVAYLSQTAAIMLHLGQKFDVSGPPGRLPEVMRQCLNCEDAFMEAYKKLNFGSTPDEGIRWARTSGRFAKWLFSLQAPLNEEGAGPFLFGSKPSFADYHMLNLLRLFDFIYPSTVSQLLSQVEFGPLVTWKGEMESRPRIKSYLKSKRNRPLAYGGIQAVDLRTNVDLQNGLQQPVLGRQMKSSGIILYYFDGFGGRANAPMLLLEDVGAEYSRSSGFQHMLQDNPACFALPVLSDNGVLISQTAAILLYLGHKFNIRGPAELLPAVMRQSLNCEDVFSEALNAGKSRDAGIRWARETGRFYKWLLSLQAPLRQVGQSFLFGSDPSFADYHMLNTLRLFDFIYPLTFNELLSKQDLATLRNWKTAMESRPGIKNYINSVRSLPILYDGVKAIA